MSGKVNFWESITARYILIGCIILFIIIVLAVRSSRPSLNMARDFVLTDKIAKNYWETDTECEICLEKGWLASNFYLRTNKKLVYLGNGMLGGLYFLSVPQEVSRDFRKQAKSTYPSIKCEQLK
jgi:hypothetical protein